MKTPYELASSVWLYRWFLVAEKYIPDFSSIKKAMHLSELAADVHIEYKRGNYWRFKETLKEFIRVGNF